ncbi:NAD(P)-dependent oxidoreductase [Rhizobium sp. BK376]|nr:NAD(P)-dependent oxidoreductase [Rhizobium sp. BK376]
MGARGVSGRCTVSGKTVGIIGLGRIGKSLVKRLSGFEARILVHQP